MDRKKLKQNKQLYFLACIEMMSENIEYQNESYPSAYFTYQGRVNNICNRKLGHYWFK